MFDQFKARAEAVGAEVHRFKSKDELLDFLKSFLAKEGVSDKENSYALWADSPLLKGIDKGKLSAEIPGLKFSVTRELAASSLVGITEMNYALADTGSLVADQTPVEDRLASTLPVIHIAIIGTNKILADKVSLLKNISPVKSPFIAFITGPSRTADIERVLTIGVHGPKRLVILFVDEYEG